MDKQGIISRTAEALTPFETGNIIHYLKNLTFKSAMENPWLIVIILTIFCYALVKRSKFILLCLFTMIAVMLLLRYTFPAGGDELSLSSTLPFAFGAMLIGLVIIYFNFIKSD